jgi:hypothetical protein
MNIKNIFTNLSIRGKQLEFIPAIFCVLWGFWIGNPWWVAFNSSSAFRLMNKIAPEWLWGLSIFLVGLFQLIFLFTKNLKFRLFSSLLSCFSLISLSVIFAFGNYESTATINYIVLALCAWLGYTELLSDIKEKKSWK